MSSAAAGGTTRHPYRRWKGRGTSADNRGTGLYRLLPPPPPKRRVRSAAAYSAIMRQLPNSVTSHGASLVSLSHALLFLLWTAQPLAQDALLGLHTDPLHPADTSSPRATLRSFDESITAAMRAWRDDRPLPEMIGPGRRALETIDSVSSRSGAASPGRSRPRYC